MSVNVPMLGLGLALVVLSVVGLLLVLRRTRPVSKPAPVAVDLSPYAVVDLSPYIVVPAATGAHAAVVDDESLADVRALRAQVRVLEEALERAADATVEQPDLASYRAQVRIAVDAIARRTSVDTDPRLAVSRVAAAVARLDADPADRVTLPVPRRRPVVVAPVVPEPLPQLEQEPAVEVAAPVLEPVVVAAETIDDEVVLPVPPPAPAAPRRSKRRSRRSAA